MTSNSTAPFIERFKTRRAHYVYDVNTNRILTVDRVVYDLLGDWGTLTPDDLRQKYTPQHGESAVERALAEIEAAREKENLFASDRPQALSLGLSPEELARAYDTQLGMMILEVTQRCNLRCHYFVYGGTYFNARTYSTRRLAPSIAFQAIDFFLAHSSQAEKRALTFYGGEPLLEFDLIRQCVDYARAKFGRAGVHFNLTTNGTLVDQEKADYFAENGFSILVSLDGPQRVHDKHRVDSQGRGSFAAVIQGLQTLYQAYGEEIQKIGINMVVTPPYDLDALQELWAEQPWLRQEMRVRAGYVDPVDTSFFEEYVSDGDRDEERSVRRRTRQRALSMFKQQTLRQASPRSPIPQAIFEQGLVKLYKRPTFSPRAVYHLNGCCIPGVRKVFVDCDGDFFLCERAHGAPALGSIHSGYDPQAIASLVDTYARESIGDCSQCWAVNLCGVCFALAYCNGQMRIEHKRISCEMERKHLAAQLQTYCRILEQDPHALDYMNEIEMR